MLIQVSIPLFSHTSSLVASLLRILSKTLFFFLDLKSSACPPCSMSQDFYMPGSLLLIGLNTLLNAKVMEIITEVSTPVKTIKGR